MTTTEISTLIPLCFLLISLLVSFFLRFSLLFGQGSPQNPWKGKQKCPQKARKIAKGKNKDIQKKQGKGEQGLLYDIVL